MKKLSVFLAEDHELVREGVKMLIESQPDMKVVGCDGDGESAAGQIFEIKPDIAIIDISMPGMNGLTATKLIRRRLPDIKILTLTRHTEDGYLRQLINAGSNGYVLKQSAPTELITAIRSIMAGGAYLDPQITQRVMGGYGGHTGNLRGAGTNELTDRENEVLRMVAWGWTNKEIAGRLQLSVKTIESHKSNAMRKLDFANRIDIVRYAILQGWLEQS